MVPRALVVAVAVSPGLFAIPIEHFVEGRGSTPDTSRKAIVDEDDDWKTADPSDFKVLPTGCNGLRHLSSAEAGQTYKEFLRLFGKSHEPVVVSSTDHVGEASAVWASRHTFISRFGNSSVLRKDFTGALHAQFGHASLPETPGGPPPSPPPKMTVADVVDGGQFFEVSLTDGLASELLELYGVPAFLRLSAGKLQQQEQHWIPTVSLGGSSSGIAFHTHGAAWLATLVGTKVWFLFPPGGFPVDQPSLALSRTSSWSSLMERDASGKPISPGLVTCTTRPGDVLWLPVGWWHATLNLGHTVAVGGQLPADHVKATKKSLAKLERLAERFPRSGLFAAQIGDWYYQQFNAPNAQMQFARARTLEPWNFKHLSNLINMMIITDSIGEAQKLAAEAGSTLASFLEEGWVRRDEAAYVLSYLATSFHQYAMQVLPSGAGHSQPEARDIDLGIQALAAVVSLLEYAEGLLPELEPGPTHSLRVARRVISMFESGG